MAENAVRIQVERREVSQEEAKLKCLNEAIAKLPFGDRVMINNAKRAIGIAMAAFDSRHANMALAITGIEQNLMEQKGRR